MMSTVISVVLITALFGLILFEGFQIVKLIYNRFSKPSTECEDQKDNEEPKEEQK